MAAEPMMTYSSEHNEMTSRYYDDHVEYGANRRIGPYGTYQRDDRGILRNKNEEYRPIPPRLPPRDISDYSEDNSTCQSCLETVLRPCCAEFFAVFVTTFLAIHLDQELTERHILSIHRISLLSLFDGMAAVIFMASFKTVHLHPAITLANLFSLSTSWLLCLLFLVIQVFASFVAVFATTTKSQPQYVTLTQDINVEWINAAYRLMFSQFLGTSLVVVTHLMAYHSERKGGISLGKLNDNPIGIFMAIVLSSFLSLLHSTCNWNPLVSTAISLFRYFGEEASESVVDQYIFWFGPAIGALLSCFLFRLLYAPEERRFIRCCEPRETHIL